ncbi:flavodoxin domain-containing protein [bacterium]|nr:flavodoxin domain-containing protein [bacterium]
MKDHTRRDFMVSSAKVAGGLLGASALGTGFLFPETAIAGNQPFPEASLESRLGTGKKVLVAYESDYGSTAEVAIAIGKTLHESGNSVDVLRVDSVENLSAYDAVIVGSPIQYDKWMPKATGFVEENREVLSKIPVAFFFTCMTLSRRTEDSLRTAQEYADKLRTLVPSVSPFAVKGFGGAVDYSKMSIFTKMLLGSILLARRVKEGDYRDWKDIHVWAETLEMT